MEEVTEWSAKIEEDPDGAAAFARELFDHLDQPALGVARQLADRGYDSLSDKQKWVLETQVFDLYGSEACERCANPIPWSEMNGAYHNGGYCSWCQHMEEKMLQE